MNAAEQLCDKSLKSSRAVRACRRAYCRARGRRGKRFWFVLEEMHMAAIEANARLLERLLVNQQRLVP